MSADTNRGPGSRLKSASVLIAGLPLILCALMASGSRDLPALTRTRTTERPLQFARYCLNYGRDPIVHTSVLTSHFRFRNIGDETIRLGEVERSCGCLTPELSHPELAPGETGEMRVSVPLTEQSAGFHEFQLTLHYSDTQPRHETVLIKAVFPEPEVRVTPRAMEVSQRVPSDRPVTHHFTITDRRASPLAVEAVESTAPWVNGTVESQDTNGEETRVALQIDGHIPQGTHRVLVRAVTNDARFPSVLMPLRIRGPERSAPVEIQPSMIRLHAAETASREVTMQIPADWQVSHVHCFPEQLRCEWTTSDSDASDNGQVVRLQLALAAPPESSSREGLVTLFANDASEMVTMRVEIVGGSRQTSTGNTAAKADAALTN